MEGKAKKNQDCGEWASNFRSQPCFLVAKDPHMMTNLGCPSHVCCLHFSDKQYIHVHISIISPYVYNAVPPRQPRTIWFMVDITIVFIDYEAPHCTKKEADCEAGLQQETCQHVMLEPRLRRTSTDGRYPLLEQSRIPPVLTRFGGLTVGSMVNSRLTWCLTNPTWGFM